MRTSKKPFLINNNACLRNRINKIGKAPSGFCFDKLFVSPKSCRKHILEMLLEKTISPRTRMAIQFFLGIVYVNRISATFLKWFRDVDSLFCKSHMSPRIFQITVVYFMSISYLFFFSQRGKAVIKRLFDT